MIKIQAHTQKQRSLRFIALCPPRLGRAATHGLNIDPVRVLEGVP